LARVDSVGARPRALLLGVDPEDCADTLSHSGVMLAHRPSFRGRRWPVVRFLLAASEGVVSELRPAFPLGPDLHRVVLPSCLDED
jgi:hypothetical protein